MLRRGGCLLVLLGWAPLIAHEFYVSPAGDDQQSGLDPAHAWRSAAKVNTAPLRPGDTVRFEAGGIWREQLLPKSGSEETPLTYRSYGEGNRPLFLGSVRANDPALWSQLSAKVWATPDGSFPIDIGSLNFNAPSYVDNPSFTDDTAGWSLEMIGDSRRSASLARTTQTFASAPAAVEISGLKKTNGSDAVHFYHEHLSLTQGKLYRLRFKARATHDFVLPRPTLVRESDKSIAYGESTSPWDGRVDAEWRTYEEPIVARVSVNDARLDFTVEGAAQDDSRLFLDDITLTELTENPSLVRNSSFDLDTADWSFSSANDGAVTFARDSTTFFSSPASARISVAASADGRSERQLSTALPALEKGKHYRLSWRARASTPLSVDRPRVKLAAASDSANSPDGDNFDGRLSSAWSTLTTEFTPSENSAAATLVFTFPVSLPTSASIWFDDITCREIFPHPSVDTALQNSNIAVRKRFESDLSQQDEFWYDAARKRILIYSEKNPADLHSTLECALSRYQCDIVGQHYVVVEGLAFWNGAKDCVQIVSSNAVTVSRCDVRFIGGGYTSKPGSVTRFGNAFQLWNSVSDVTIAENYVLNIFDAGISNQGLDVNRQDHLFYRYNTLLACQYSFELWDRPVGSVMNDVYFEHNLCRDAGRSFSFAQRRDMARASHLCLALTTATTHAIFIRDNLFDTSTKNLIWRTPDLLDHSDEWIIDFNRYRQRSGPIASWAGKIYGETDWSQYQTDSRQDGRSTFVGRTEGRTNEASR